MQVILKIIFMLSWKEIVQNYIARHSGKIREVTRPLRDHLGVSYFTYHRIDKDGKYTVLVDRPDWAEHYVEEKYYLDDPYLRDMSVYKSGFCFLEEHGSAERTERILKDGREIFNLDLAVLYIERHHDSVEFFGFSGKKAECSLEKTYLNHPMLLKSFGSYFKKELNTILHQMQEEAGPLIDLKGSDFLCPQLVHPSITENAHHVFLQKIGRAQDVFKAGLLSQREKECLKLMIRGNTAKQIAHLLHLSPRTVESYFENMKNKLSCFSKQELFSVAKSFDEIGLL